MSGNCRLHEVLQEVELGDRVDDVHSSVQTATTDTSSKQDTELDDEVQPMPSLSVDTCTFF